MRYQHQRAAITKGSPQFPDREVEGKRVEQAPNITGLKTKVGVCSVEQAHHLSMLDHDPFGLSG
ncbi:hypothetical protein D3C81_1817580 [compost metagenome]